MPSNTIRRRKPMLSAHQKQIRFFTRLALCTGFLLVAGIFWLVNRASYSPH
jgi:hypothetical protein